MNGDALGYVALSLLAGILTLSFILACAVIGLWFKFGESESEYRAELWREAVFGSKEKGR